jgi:nucleoside-triphosphatase THEP1
MTLAYTMAPGRGDTDLVLQRVAADLMASGLKCIGTVQVNTERQSDCPCDMDVRVLPDGPVLRISQHLGAQSRGCRLDPAALETAVGLVAARLVRGVDLLIVNKFGKHEAEGRGFRDVIAEAVAMDVPVLVGLNALNREAFEAFSGGLAIQLAPEPGVLRAWVDTVTAIAAEPA